jgi:DNA-binding transcriptional MerR regulator
MNSIVERQDPASEEAVWQVPDRSNNPAEVDRAEFSGAELAKLWGVTMRALRFYESRGLISPRRDGRVRAYSQRDSQRIGIVLRAKKLGFTLAEIGQMIDLRGAAAASGGLQLTAQKCLQQISHLESQLKDTIEALADLRRIHLEICCKAADTDADA